MTIGILISILLLLYVLPILFTAELHTHPCHNEYGVRVAGTDKYALVIGFGLKVIRIEWRRYEN